MRLAILASHPVQYQAPLFRELAKRLDLAVFFAHCATPADHAAAGFGTGFEWDVDLCSGFEHRFLENRSQRPGLDRFGGCDTPSVAAEIGAGEFDALLVMGWHLKTYWQGIWSAKRYRIPVMVRGDSHLATPRSAFKRAAKSMAYPIGLRVFDAALFVGERSRRYWEHYRYPRERLVFSPHCVDVEWFASRATADAGRALRKRYGIDLQAKVVLLAGKLIALKRPLDLVAAIARANASVTDLTLVLAGAGALAEEISAAAVRNGVRLVALGFCNQSVMPAVYSAADVLALPSEHETWGLVANEALACGCPIIVSDGCGCAPDLAADGTVGRVFPVGNIDALAEGLAALIKEPPSQEHMRVKSAAYSIDAAAQGICDALQFVASKKGASP